MIDTHRVRDKQRPTRSDLERPEAPRKVQPSPFDQVLQQGRMPPRTPMLPQPANREERDTEAQRRRAERDKPRERSRHKDDDHGTTRSARSEKGRQSEGPQHRVVEKHGEREQQGEQQRDQRGGHGSGGHAGHGGGGGSRAKAGVRSEAYAKSREALGQAAKSEFQHTLLLARAPVALPSKQMQQLVNLLVQSIRVGKNELGDAELQLVFQTAIFKGLRLRLQDKGGKVAVTFSSHDPGVRALFARERKRIVAALQERGVVVDEVTVGA